MQSRRPKFSDEQNAAMRVVEALIQEGLVVLAPDRWVEGSLRFQRPSVLELEAQQGEAISFALDPLEQAIESTVRMLDDGAVRPANTSSSIRMILLEHLRSLLAAQLKRVTSHD